MWLDQQVSLFNNNKDNVGRPATIGDVLFSRFGIDHEIDGKNYNDLDTIIELRKIGPGATDETKKRLKDTLQGFTPAALLIERKKLTDEENKNKFQSRWNKVITPTGLVQLDFDYGKIKQWDIDSLKKWVFALPFVAYCSLSASGTGFFALVLIAEPERMNEYAKHLFEVFESYGVSPDTSKGEFPTDLRYLSYDSSPLIRDNPDPLKVIFKPKVERKTEPVKYSFNEFRSSGGVVNVWIDKIRSAPNGERWPTVRRAAYRLGGLGDDSLLDQINEAIKNSSQYAGYEDHCLKGASDSFRDGKRKPYPVQRRM